MDNNKIIMLALVAIIVVLAIALFASMSTDNKIDTELTIKGNSTLYKGDSISVKLTDINGNPIVNQEINITIIDEKNRSDYRSVVTDDNGVGKLKLDKDVGNYTINCTYGGNDIYAGNSATKKITIEEEVVEAEPTSYSSAGSSSSSGSSNRYTRDEAGLYDTQTGKYVGGQNDGQTKEQVKEYNEGILREEGLL